MSGKDGKKDPENVFFAVSSDNGEILYRKGQIKLYVGEQNLSTGTVRGNKVAFINGGGKLILCDELGNCILDNFGRTIAPETMIMIDLEGDIYLLDNQGDIQNGGIKLGFFTFENPDKLEKLGDNLYGVTEESGEATNIEGVEFKIKIERK